jgi:signal peptidase II
VRLTVGTGQQLSAVPASRYLAFFAIVTIGCAADLVTKSLVFGWLGMPGHNATWWVWSDIFGFQTSLNEGALFGMGKGMVAVFAGLSIIAAIGIVIWLFWGGAAGDAILTVALGLITAGILGNLYDRLGLPGLTGPNGARIYAVRDWILVMIGDWPWPTFNIADSLLVCGAVLLVWHALRHEVTEHPTPAKKG